MLQKVISIVLPNTAEDVSNTACAVEFNKNIKNIFQWGLTSLYYFKRDTQ